MFSKVSPEFRKILGNTSWLIGDYVLRMGVGLFVGVWVARYLGPARYGSLNFALSFVAVFGALSTLGLDSMVIREVVRDEETAPNILGSTFILRLVASFIAIGASIVTVGLLDSHDRMDLLLVSIVSLGLFFQVFDTIDSYFKSHLRSKLTVWAKNSAFLLAAALRVSLIVIKAPLWAFAAASTVEWMLGAVGLVIAYRTQGGSLLRWRASWTTTLHLLRDGWPLILSGVAMMIYMRIDMVMLKVMQGDTAAGIYAAATKVSEIWYFIPVAIGTSAFPAIVRSKDNPDLYYGRLRALFSTMIMLAVGLGLVIGIASPWIIELLFTSAFRAAGPVLAVHIWSSVFIFLSAAQRPWDVSENLLKLAFGRRAAGAIVNILLNLVLIPRYSAMGAAIATVVSYSIPACIGNAFDARTRPIFYMQLKAIKPDYRSLMTIFRGPAS